MSEEIVASVPETPLAQVSVVKEVAVNSSFEIMVDGVSIAKYTAPTGKRIKVLGIRIGGVESAV